MENNLFDKASKLVHEHDELTKMLKDMENSVTSLAVVYSDWDGPGINYTAYSKDIKKFIIEAINARLKDIELNFN